MSLTTKLVAVAALIFPFAVAPAQDLTSFLKDSKIPQKIKPADLGEDMKAFKIVYEKQGGGDPFSSLMNSMMMMMGSLGQAMGGEEKPENPQEAAAMVFFDRLSICWTNGSTIKLFDQDFLVTYAVQINLAEAMRSKNPPDLSKNDLILTLVNTKAIASITPRSDMTKEEWLKSSPPPPSEGNAKASSMSNLKQIATATMIYASDYDDVLPYVQSTNGAYELLFPYAKSKEIFKSLNPNGSKFLLNMAVAGATIVSIPMPTETVLFYEDKEWPDGTRLVAFADGHVKAVGASQWATLQTSLTKKFPKVGKPLPATLGSNWDGG